MLAWHVEGLGSPQGEDLHLVGFQGKSIDEG